MGLAMSMNLQRYLASTDQPSLRYNNRTMSRGDILKDLGGVPHDSISELLDEADIIFMSVCDNLGRGSNQYSMICPDPSRKLIRAIITDQYRRSRDECRL